MGWSGWDMPKEHWLRKNRAVFARRKEQVDFKLRTQSGEHKSGNAFVPNDTGPVTDYQEKYEADILAYIKIIERCLNE